MLTLADRLTEQDCKLLAAAMKASLSEEHLDEETFGIVIGFGSREDVRRLLRRWPSVPLKALELALEIMLSLVEYPVDNADSLWTVLGQTREEVRDNAFRLVRVITTWRNEGLI